jgi:hypothetical protein
MLQSYAARWRDKLGCKKYFSKDNSRQPDLTKKLDSQTFAAFGAACVDHSTTTWRFHACQKAVGTSAANFRGLVSAFHDSS